MYFFADNKSNRAEFIRIPPDASVTKVKELMHAKWCKERPSLVISVTGGAKAYNMKPRLLRAFRRGLLKVTSSTGAWIITGGMNTGIMKLVGEIVQIYPSRCRPIHLIGISTWGCIAGVQQLDGHGENVSYHKPASEGKGVAPLEPNHTEFIFIDDGSDRKYGREISFRARLEKAISGDFFASLSKVAPKMTRPSLTPTPTSRPEPSDPIPVVLLVVEGGPNTVRTVHEAVVENSIPAVFLEGTGRCCDLFAKAFNLYNEYRQEFGLTKENPQSNIPATLRRFEELKNKLREALKQELCAISGAGDGSDDGRSKKASKTPATAGEAEKRKVDTTDYFELVYECIHTQPNFLNIISLNSRSSVEPDIDLAILEALLKATSGSDSRKTNDQRKYEQFRLALEWNRVDIVKKKIMTHDRDWDTLKDLFEIALNRNQTEFVKLFLDHDFSLTDLFRNHDKFLLLYQNSMKEPHHSLPESNNPLQSIYQQVIQPLIGDFFKIDVASRSPISSSHTRVNMDNDDDARSCCSRSLASPNNATGALNDFAGSSPLESNSNYYLDIDKELFLWSVIEDKREFTLLFWSRGKNKICAALIATLIYRKRASKDKDNSYEQIADEFENLAVQILDEFYQVNSHTCIKALIRLIPAYGNVTWLQLAAEADAKKFISQRAVQEVLNNIWYGYIRQQESERKIIFSTFMLWYSGCLQYQDELVKTYNQKNIKDDSNRKSNLSQRTSPTKTLFATEKGTDGTQMRLMHDIEDRNTAPVHFVAVGCCEQFLRAPYVKYLYNLYLHVVFLLLFSYVLLCDFFPLYEFQTDVCGSTNDPEKQDGNNNSPSVKNDEAKTNITVPYGFHKHDRPAFTEYILFLWVTTLLCEELRQLFSFEAHSVRKKITAYFEVFWNKLDFLAIMLFYVGFIFRFIPFTECFCAARIVLSVDLSLWFIRLLDIFAAIKRLGPKLVMIGEMVHDLKFYMLMLIVFILGFGVSAYSLIHGANKFTWHLPRDIIHLAYWEIFGELSSLSKFENNYRATGYTIFVLLIIYMAIVSIVLVNLLIAMFSNTFDRLHNDTDRIWKFQRYSLVCEYLSRPAIPPPFILLAHLWRFVLYISAHCTKSQWFKAKYNQHKNRTKYQIKLDEKSAANIEIVEDQLGDEVYYNYVKTVRKSPEEHELDEERVQTPQDKMFSKMGTLEDRVRIISSQQAHVLEYLDCIIDGFKMIAGDCIRVPERRRLDPDESCSIYNSSN
ncbi:unnamed protein product [Rotaria sp. Silwood2]|nr:unnamed protein product [Rotaria sp. Silwood2]